MKAYDELIDRIAAGVTPLQVIDFHASKKSKQRVSELLFKEKNEQITFEEKSELDAYMNLEHIMRLAKARAYQYAKI